MPEIPESIHRCRLLVDGYNLLFGQGWAQPGSSSHPGLQRGRETLAQRVAEHVPADRLSSVWIVFDSLDAPSHLPTSIKMRHMEVIFSRDWSSADEMLQQIVVSHSSPRSLVVISSDHAVQRKAIARGARVYDHDRWEEAIEDAYGVSKDSSPSQELPEPGKDRTLSNEERDDWMKRFGF